MATYTNETSGVSFDLPDAITVRKQLAYRHAVASATDTADIYGRFWKGFLMLVDNWQCELAPDVHAIDLDTDTRRQVADIVVWACNTLAAHMNDLEDVPKNS